MHRHAALALCALLVVASPLPAAAQGEPSAAPTSEVEGHALPAIHEERAPPSHEAAGEAREGAPVEAVAPAEQTGMMMAAAIFTLALLSGLIGLWFASRAER